MALHFSLSTIAQLDIWGESDEFQYYQQQATGDIAVEVHITSFTASEDWAKGGLMIRNSIDPDSEHFSIFLSRGMGPTQIFRMSEAGETELGSGLFNVISDSDLSGLRIIKQGSLFRA